MRSRAARTGCYVSCFPSREVCPQALTDETRESHGQTTRGDAIRGRGSTQPAAFRVQGEQVIIVLKSHATDADVADVCRRIEAMGHRPHTIRGELRTVIGAVGDDRGKERLRALESLECVESVTPILQPFKLASREVRPESSTVVVDGVVIGGARIAVMAGPCSVESREQLLEAARKVQAA